MSRYNPFANIGTIISTLTDYVFATVSDFLNYLELLIFDSGASVKGRKFGAIGDGSSHPLSTKYATLAEAQAFYPKALALTEEIDYHAFQKCVDHLTAKGVGKTIYAPLGDYMISNPIISKTTVNFRGAGRFLTVLHPTTTLSDYLIKIEGGGVSAANSLNHIEISKLTINGDAKTAPLGGIKINWVYMVRFSEVEVYNFNNVNFNGLYLGNCFNVYTQSSRFAGSLANQKGNGVYIMSDVDTGSTKGENVTQIKFDDCLLQYNNIGLKTDFGTGGSQVTFTNGGIGRNASKAVEINGNVSHIEFSMNHIELQPIGIDMFSPAKYVFMVNNDFYDVDIAIQGDGIEGIDVDKNTFNGASTFTTGTVLKLNNCTRVNYGYNKVYTVAYPTMFDTTTTGINYKYNTTQVISNNGSSIGLNGGVTQVFVRNTANALISNILNATDGQLVVIFIEDGFTKILPSATILLNRGIAGNGSSVTVRYNKTTNKWSEYTRSELSAGAAPTTGNWSQGCIVWNNNALPGGYVGWVCYTGSPLVFKGFGLIET